MTDRCRVLPIPGTESQEVMSSQWRWYQLNGHVRPEAGGRLNLTADSREHGWKAGTMTHKRLAYGKLYKKYTRCSASHNSRYRLPLR